LETDLGRYRQNKGKVGSVKIRKEKGREEKGREGKRREEKRVAEIVQVLGVCLGINDAISVS
jgi:hypothetical protein